MSNQRLNRAVAQFSRNSLSPAKRWASVEVPTYDPASLNIAIDQLKQRSDVQSRIVGDVRDSFITVQDLISLGILGKNGENLYQRRLDDLEARVEALEALP